MKPKTTRTIACLVAVASLVVGISSAYALCTTPAEEGSWRNYDPNTRGITRCDVRFQCQDQILNGQPYPPGSPYYIKLWGKCHPSDCYWGERGATRDASGWIRTTYNHGYATRHVWVKAYTGYSVDWLRVYVWTDFHDGRTDYAMDDWYLRS